MFSFDPANGDDDTHDAGLVPVADIGNYVWVDADGDGIQDSDEIGLENVEVVLYDATTGLPIDTVYTDVDGEYLFEDVPAGDYFVGFDPSTSPTAGANFLFTDSNTGNGSNDSDADPSGFTSTISFDPMDGSDLTIDAGVVPAADIGDTVWVDTDGDGIQDPGESGVEGVTVILFDADTGLPIDTVVTDINGNYLFEDVPSGNYYIEFDASTSPYGDEFTFTQFQQGGNDGLDSDADANGNSPVFAFDAFAGDKLTCDAGIIPTPEIRTIKNVLSTSTLPNGNVEITFELGVKNTGPVDLTNISLIDDLTTQLGTTYQGLASPVVIVASTATSTPALNPAYNGMGNNDVFAGAATDLLEPDQEVKVNVTIIIDPAIANYPLTNQAQAAGDGLDDDGNPLEDGSGNPLTVTDDSDAGTDYEGTNPGVPGDQGTEDDPTILDCIPANIVITGEPIGICPSENISLTVVSDIIGATYEWREVGSMTIISTSANPTFFNVTATTDYEVTVINPSGVCYFNLQDTTTITVYSAPELSPDATYNLNPDCSPSDLLLEADVDITTGTAPYTFEWTGPNGFTSTLENPTIVNATELNNGTYNITVTDANGCLATANVEVTGIVNNVAQPVITSTGPACEGETVVLNIPAYTGSSVTYTWTTPDGSYTNMTGEFTNTLTISPVDNAIHEGGYTVTVDVDGCVLTSPVFDVEIFDTPTLAPTYATPDSCDGGTLELYANATGVTPLSYLWEGPNGWTSTLENPVINNIDVTNNGQYILTVTSVSGCTAQDIVPVNNILPPAEAPTIASPDVEICEGEDIVLTTSAGGTNFEWIGPLGASTGTLALPGLTTATGSTSIPSGHPSYVSGEYSVSITNADGCVVESEPIMITIYPIPSVLANNDSPVCEGTDVQLSASTITGATYSWYDADPDAGPANLISMEQNPTMMNLPSGVYTYWVTVEMNGCTSPSASTTATVNPAPTTAPTASYTLNTNCSPSDLSLMAVAGGTAPFSFAWTGPNGFISSLENPTLTNVTSAANGTYDIVVTDANGCTATGNVEVTGILDAVPQPIISASGPVCDGESVVISVPAYEGSSVNYDWTIPSTVNVSGINTNEITISPVDSILHEGDYYVTIIVDGCTVTSDTFNLELHPTPFATPMATATPLCEGEILSLTANATGATTYAWTGPNGFTSNAQDPQIDNITIANNGTYVLTVTNISGCMSTASVVVNNISETPTSPTITSNSPVCEDENIILAIQEQYNGTTITYNWTNGAGTTISTNATVSIPATDPNAISPYRVEVTVDGCTSELSEAHEVIVNDLPISIATNAGSICPGENAQLFGNSIAGASYEWRISGSPTVISTEQNPVIIGLAATTIYELTVISAGCISNPTSTTQVTVNPSPAVVPMATYALNTDCSPSDLSLEAVPSLGTTPYTFSWTGPNGFTSTLENPTIANATELNNGTYDVTVTDANGCTAVGNIEVNGIVNDVSQPIITSTGPACEGETIVLSIPAYSGSNVTYAWTTADGSFTNMTGEFTNELTISPVIDAIHQGSYTVTVNVDGCILTSPVFDVEVFDTPTANPSYVTPDSCTGGSLELFANATGITDLTYAWSGPNGFTSDLENPVIPNITVANNGEYVLTVTTVSGCSFTNSVPVDNILPPAEIPTIASPDIEICEGEDIVLTTSASGTNFEWIGPLGASTGTLALPGLTTPTGATSIPMGHDSYLSGEYSVRVTDANGCVITSESITITIYSIPEAIASNDGPHCFGSDAQLFANTVSGATYRWYNSDPLIAGADLISFEQNPVILNPLAGLHTYWLTVEVNGCVSPSSITTFTIHALPTAEPMATYNLNTDCTPSNLSLEANVLTGASPYTFSWTGPNGFISSLENPVIQNATEENNGTYDVIVTDANGCIVSANVEVNGIINAVAQPVITSSGPACEGETVVLSIPAYTGSNVTYTWTTADGSFTNMTGEFTNALTISPTVDAIHQGDYTVTVDVDGCILTSPIYNLEIFDTPSANPSYVTPDSCTGGSLELFANGSGVTNLAYSWSGPNGFTSTLENPVIPNIDISHNGEYIVTVSTLSGCSATGSIVVDNILPPAEPATIASPDAEICDGEDIVLVTSKAGVQFEWIGPLGASIPTLALPGLTTTTGMTTIPLGHDSYLSGEYQVRVTDANGCVCISDPMMITIHSIPNVFASNTSPVCEGTDVTLEANTVAGATYRWYNGDPALATSTLISQDEDPVMSGLAAGMHTFYVTVEVNDCISPVATTTVSIYDNPTTVPTASYTAISNCAPTDLFLFANATGGSGTYTYAWTGPNGFTSNVQDPIITNANSSNNGSYTVTIVDDNGCTSFGSVEVNTVVDPLPQPLISSSGQVCDGEQVTIWVPEYQGSSVDYVWTLPSTVNVTGINTHELTINPCLLYTSPSPRDQRGSRMPSSA